MKTINITVDGGVIQDITDIPNDVQVIVRDYDVDGNEENLLEDEGGYNYVESIWGSCMFNHTFG
jgi:hypothetical protein